VNTDTCTGAPMRALIDGIEGINGINGINGQDGIIPWWLYGVAAVALGASVYSVNKSRQKPKA
jgi:hypothetical protein